MALTVYSFAVITSLYYFIHRDHDLIMFAEHNIAAITLKNNKRATIDGTGVEQKH